MSVIRSPKSPKSPRRGGGGQDNEITKNKHARVWELMSQWLSHDVNSVEQYIVNHLEYTLARSRFNFDDFATFQAVALSVRDRMIERFNDTQQYFTKNEIKRVYILSPEYFPGRSLKHAILNIGLLEQYTQALKNLNYNLDELYVQEADPALGNAGVALIASSELDSLATLNYPGWGYGIRYQYGNLHQEIRNGFQVESPDYWLTKGNPFEILRTDVAYTVRFGGHVVIVRGIDGNLKFIWEGGDLVKAVAYDTPISGFGTVNTLNLRLWSSVPHTEFDLTSFIQEDYYGALKSRQHSEHITSIINPRSKELRLKQQYFFCSASMRDAIRRFKKTKRSLRTLPSLVVFQLNNTQPLISIPELMRILMDEEQFGWDDAWTICTSVFTYSNHNTLEDLETFSIELLSTLLPRHIQIIFEINRRFLLEIDAKWPGDLERATRMSLIDETTPKSIRMAHLGIVGSFSVNGVSKVHTNYMKDSMFADFYELWPNKFNSKTNGVSTRRWILCANPNLAELFTAHLGGTEWVTDHSLVASLKEKFLGDEGIRRQFSAIKLSNKEKLRRYIWRVTQGVNVDVNAIFDIHAKRFHEQKRQLLNIIGIIARYNEIKNMTTEQKKLVVPRVCIFAGKADVGYSYGKAVIKLINSVAEVVNYDYSIGNLLKIVFIPNLNISISEMLAAASDISQHISAAGTEPSGVSNIYYAMNGGLLLGTYDGLNVELLEEIGEDNMFLFGADAREVNLLRKNNFSAQNSQQAVEVTIPVAFDSVAVDPAVVAAVTGSTAPITVAAAVAAATVAPVTAAALLKETPPLTVAQHFQNALSDITSGKFGDYTLYSAVIDPVIKGNDRYLIARDFPSYFETQKRVEVAFSNKQEWVKKSITTTLGMAKFSIDSTIRSYVREIWDVEVSAMPLDEWVGKSQK